MRQTVSRGYKDGDLHHPAEYAVKSTKSKDIAVSGSSTLTELRNAKTANFSKSTISIPVKRAFKFDEGKRPASASFVRQENQDIKESKDVPKENVPDKQHSALIEYNPESFVDVKRSSDADKNADVVPQVQGRPRDEFSEASRASLNTEALRDELSRVSEELKEKEAIIGQLKEDETIHEKNMEKMTNSCLQYKQKCQEYADSNLNLTRQQDTLEQELIQHKMQLSEILNSHTATGPPAFAEHDKSPLQLQNKVVTLETENMELEKQLEHLNRICGALQIQVKSFESKEIEWQSFKECQQRLEVELRDTIESLKKQAEAFEDVQNKMEQMPSISASRPVGHELSGTSHPQEIKEKNEAYAQEIELLKREKNAINLRVLELEKETIAKESVISNLKAQQGHLSLEFNTKSSTMELTNRNLSEQIIEHQNLRESLQEKEKCEFSHQTAVDSLTRQVDDLHQLLDIAAQDKETISQERIDAEVSVQEHIRQLDGYESKLKNTENDLRDANLTIAELEIIIKRLKSEHEQFKNIKYKCDELEQNAGLNNDILESFKIQLSVAKDNLADAMNKNLLLLNQLSKKDAEIGELNNHIVEVKGSLDLQALEHFRYSSDAEGKIRALESAIHVSRSETDSIVAMKANQIILENEIASKNSVIESYVLEMDGINKELHERSIEILNQIDVIKSIKEINHNLQLKVVKLDAELKVVSSERLNDTLKIQQFEEDLNELRGNLDDAGAVKLRLENEMRKSNAVAETYKSQIEELNVQVSQITCHNEELFGKNKLSDERCTDLCRQILDLESKIEVTTATLSSKHSESSKTIKGLEEDIKILHSQLNRTSESEKLCDDLKKQVAEHSNHAQICSADIETMKQNTSKMVAERDELLAQIESSKTEIKQYQLQLNELTMQVDQHRSSELLLATKNIGEVKSLEGTIEILRAQLNEARTFQLKCGELEHQLKLRAAVNENVHAEKIGVLEMQLDDQCRRYKDAEKKIKALEESRQKLDEHTSNLPHVSGQQDAKIDTAPNTAPIGRGVIVIHCGGTELQTGHLDENLLSPPAKFPNGYFLGNDAISVIYDHPDPALRGILKEESLFSNGDITSFEYFEGIIQQILLSLGAYSNPDAYKVIMTHKPLMRKDQREKIVHTLFDSCHMQGVFLTTDAQMCLRAINKTTGLVVDLGSDVTYIVPIYEGMLLEHAVVKLPLGGDAIVDFLVSMLLSQDCEEFHKIPTRLQKKIARSILATNGIIANDFISMTEKFGHFQRTNVQVLPSEKCNSHVWHRVAQTPSKHHPLHSTFSFQLPNGGDLTLNFDVERFTGPELLWNPSLDPECHCEMSLQAAILKSITLCDPLLQGDLVSHIVCIGELASLPGFKDRLYREVQISLPTCILGAEILKNESNSAFNGTTLYASELRDDVWIHRYEYEIEGASIVHSKCF
ncbi:Aste57867_23477 [Aphanomyces stellatus]|uniref:Aste57867_23477 protein n=1 Tax=Aphanomyces stellatus TaxID=120398 RepID=A0A485LNM3_9STRA|nr:hypothetical protein As57867_023406 [Aphanomyces stellatus]VFU00122.1 Aste57867_23477 [Aphanomyces stellatus]